LAPIPINQGGIEDVANYLVEIYNEIDNANDDIELVKQLMDQLFFLIQDTNMDVANEIGEDFEQLIMGGNLSDFYPNNNEDDQLE
jgi:hypothetical protein